MEYLGTSFSFSPCQFVTDPGRRRLFLTSLAVSTDKARKHPVKFPAVDCFYVSRFTWGPLFSQHRVGPLIAKRTPNIIIFFKTFNAVTLSYILVKTWRRTRTLNRRNEAPVEIRVPTRLEFPTVVWLVSLIKIAQHIVKGREYNRTYN